MGLLLLIVTAAVLGLGLGAVAVDFYEHWRR